jgi:hypothetical protein
MTVQRDEDGMKTAFDGNALRCPGCGSTKLHHDHVEVFERRHDDSSEGFHVIVDCDAASATVVNSLTGNPSERRGGLFISFWCEGCEKASRLDLAQDKGETLVSLTVVSST